MSKLRAGVIGCGGRGKEHAKSYAETSGVDVVACAEPDSERRQSFCDQFGVSAGYADYRELLKREELDIVSVCTWPQMHKEMILAAVDADVRAINSEKPMAPTWGDCKAIYQTCADNNVLITFCHQRRLEPPFMTARKLVEEGAIGRLIRMEAACPDLFDWGTHWFDIFHYYNREIPAKWVMGQIDRSAPAEIFGMPVTTSGLAWIRYYNDVEGLLTTGEASHQQLGIRPNRLVGTEGIVEVNAGQDEAVRMLRSGSDWQAPPLVEAAAGSVTALIADLVQCLQTGGEPLLSGDKALRASELIFATYESSRRRARIDLPLQTEDSALLSMLEEGVI